MSAKAICHKSFAITEKLEAGHSDALTNYLTTMSRFHNYSFGNVLEIARQIPYVTTECLKERGNSSRASGR
jgi:hypothetical protein